MVNSKYFWMSYFQVFEKGSSKKTFFNTVNTIALLCIGIMAQYVDSVDTITSGVNP